MVEQTGEEIDWDRCPPEWDDFPTSVETAMNVFNSIGDHIYPEVGYVGKDFTNLEILYKFYKVEETNQQDWIFELLLHLESDTIAKSQKRLKSEYDKMKKK